MDLTGRWPHMSVNRPLSESERANRLDIRQRHDVVPEESFSTIKMNSTYIEVVDKCYYWRGLSLLLAIPFLPAVGSMAIAGPVLFIKLVLTSPVVAAISLAWTAASWYCLIKIGLPMLTELFNLTHNPIRLNRRNQMLYAFSYLSGRVVSARWDEVFFTMTDSAAARPMRACGMLMGHILDDDGATVKDTILFARVADSPDNLIPYWEYLRRYMEEGPEELIALVERCLPLDEKKESPLMAWKVVSARLFVLLAYPLWLCRRLAMYTSKIPRWPEWVETECAIPPDDPHVRNSEQDPPLTEASCLPYHGNIA